MEAQFIRGANLIDRIERQPNEFDFLEIAVGEFTRDITEVNEEALSETLENEEDDLVIHLPFGQPFSTTIEEFKEAEEEYFQRVIEFSGRLDAEKVFLHPSIRYREDKEDFREGFKIQLQKMGGLCRENNLELCVENVQPITLIWRRF